MRTRSALDIIHVTYGEGGSSNEMSVHSVQLPDGSVWDAANGWRVPPGSACPPAPDTTPALKQERRDEVFMSLARGISELSKDPSTKVGALIVDAEKRVVSMGYNGFPRGVDDDPVIYNDRARKYMRVLHAEENAVLFANRSLEGCTAYITMHPCSNCAARLIQVGIKRVVCPQPDTARWRSSHMEAQWLFEEAGVAVTRYTPGGSP